MSDFSKIRMFRLRPVEEGRGISCDATGLFVKGLPLLKCDIDSFGRQTWSPRSLNSLNSDLSKRYGFPIDFASRLGGLNVVTQALNQGNISRAIIAALHLQLPEPPARNDCGCQICNHDLGAELCASGLLKADWNPAKHPRWPAGDPAARGGQFAPADSGSDFANPSPRQDIMPQREDADQPVLIPAQATIPWGGSLDIPLEIPWRMPAPLDIVPPAVDVPNQQERKRPPLVNPFPDRRNCVAEWEEAEETCRKYKEKGAFKPGYSGFGKDYVRCVLGHVSEACGGNRLDA